MLEIRDHAGVLHELRDSSGRLVYSSRSNYERTMQAIVGRPNRALRHKHGRMGLCSSSHSFAVWCEPYGLDGRHRDQVARDRTGKAIA